MALIAAHALLYYVPGGGVGMDAHAYWLAGHVSHPYQAGPGEMDAYLYSPLFLQIVRPLTWLPWHVFLALWLSLEASAYWWLLRKAPWRWRVPGLLMAVPELVLGNIYAFIGVSIVMGLRYPAAWAFPLLTKDHPGRARTSPGWLAAGSGDALSPPPPQGRSVGMMAVSLRDSNHVFGEEWIGFLADHSGGGPGRDLADCR